MKKILFLSHSPLWGGAEKCLYLLLKALPRDQFDPLVLLPDDGALRESISALGIETRLQPIPPWVRPAVDRWPGTGFSDGVAPIVKLIELEQIDVVFSNTSVIVGGALAARICGIPHIWHVLEILSSDPALSPVLALRDFYPLMGILADRIIAASDSVRAELQQFKTSASIEVIHSVIEDAEENSLDRRKESVFGLPEDTFVVSFVGELSERKGVEDLVSCVPSVLARNPDAHFMIVGRDAGRAPAVRDQIVQRGLENAVQLLGFRDDIRNIMAASDVFVLPTRSDPLPLAVQEAMSVGTPVVATMSGGCADLVVDGETGCLVPVGNRTALSSAIILLMESPEMRRRMGELGRQRLSSSFSQQRYIERMTAVLADPRGSNTGSSGGLAPNDLLGILIQSLDACVARYSLEEKHQQLIRSHEEILQSHDDVENAFSTQLGRFLTSPWRVLQTVLGKS